MDAGERWSRTRRIAELTREAAALAESISAAELAEYERELLLKARASLRQATTKAAGLALAIDETTPINERRGS